MKRTCLQKNTNTDEHPDAYRDYEFHPAEISLEELHLDPKETQQVKSFVRMKRIFFLLLLICFTVILQAQVSKTLTIAAGELAANLSPSERATVTNLNIAGFIDARDFKTMRDSMPVLSVIDISQTAIVEYRGTNGPWTGDWIYIENKVPGYSFNVMGTSISKTTLTSILLPESVTSIGNAAFRQCTGLAYINMPTSLTTIDSWSFAYAGNALVLNIPATTTSISEYAFRAFNGTLNIDANNPNYSTHEGVFYNKNKTILYNCSTTKTGSYAIPGTVTDIKTYAFASCRLLDGIVTVPISVTKIKQYTFRDCNSLQQVILPNTLTELEGNIFWNCYALTTINLPVLASITGDGVFLNCTGLRHIYANASNPIDLSARTDVFQRVDKANCTLHVPSGSLSAYKSAAEWKDFGTIVTSTQLAKTLTISAGELAAKLSPTERATVTNLYLTGTIDARDFKTMRDSLPILSVIDISQTAIVEYSGTNGTRSINYTYSANHIPYSAFSWSELGILKGKTTLTSIQIPESITTIKNSSFYLCSSLNSINFPNSLSTIESRAFYFCGNSLNMTIPANTINISNTSFSALKGTITVDPNNPVYSSEDGVLFNKTKTQIITCPASKSGAYNIPQSVTEIGSHSFFFCTLLTGPIIIPSSVTKIGDWAFGGCDGLLGTLTIPASVTIIEDAAFLECIGLSAFYSYATNPANLSTTSNVFLYIDKTACNLYVPTGSLSAYQAASEWQDFSNIIEIDGYRLSGNKRSIGADQNSKAAVDLYAYTAWTAYSNMDWLTCSPTSGNYDATLNLTADVNTTASARIAKVYVESPGHATHFITVTQAAGPGLATLDDMEITNRTIPDQSSKCFGAHNSITVAGNGTTVNFENGSTVNLIAEQSIRFLPGFHAQSGTYTHAYISNTFCDQLPAPIVAAESIAEKSLGAIVPEKTEDQIIGQASLKVFPNPNKGSFKIQLKNVDTPVLLMIFNAAGAAVYQTKINETTLTVDLTNAQPGIYFVKTMSLQEHLSHKIIIH